MIQNLLNQFLGTNDATPSSSNQSTGIGEAMHKMSSNIPGGLAGGAAAGGIMALLVSSKSARKIAGTAATYGGAALLGGMAYKAFQNWQQSDPQHVNNSPVAEQIPQVQEQDFTQVTSSNEFQLSLIKAMIAAAKADGHVDEKEYQRIFSAVDKMGFTAEAKGILFDLLQKPITISELASEVTGLEQKTELYLASCLAINPDHPSETAYLEELATALQLPKELADQLQWQAQQTMTT